LREGINMTEINFNGGSMIHKGIEETVDEMKGSLDFLSKKFKVVTELSLQRILHELMENYVSLKNPPYPEYNGGFRNEFIEMTAKTLNKLYENETFQDNYKITYKKIEEKR
jgi:hypothetical protein